MKIYSFEDLKLYQKARVFRKRVYEITRALPTDEKYVLVPQIRRAVNSITNNIAEGFGRYHYQENMQFCRHSRGSLNEVIDQINICFDEGYITKEQYSNLKKEAFALIKILNGYIASIRKTQKKTEKNNN